MPIYELPGEPLQSVFPAHVEIIEFHGIEVLRIIGVEDQVWDTTKVLDELYPDDDKRTFGDAQHIGYCRGPDNARPIPMYELIVLRKAKS